MTPVTPITAAIERVRREARAAVVDLTLPRGVHDTAWMVMRGARNPKVRRDQPNLGSPQPQPGWHLLATVFEGGEHGT